MMRPIESVRRSPKFAAKLERARAKFLAAAPDGALESLGGAAPPDPDEALEVLRGTRAPEALAPSQEATLGALEAIVLEEMRPPYFILRDRIEINGDYDHVDLISANKVLLEKICLGVGRVDLFHHGRLPYAGTGWMIERDIAVTNSHVASVFAELDFARRLRFKRGTLGNDMEARLDYVRQRDDGGIRRRADVLEVLYISGPGEPDIAFLKVETVAEVEPLELFTGRVERDTPIAAVGYPAADPDRNDPDLMNSIFGGKFDVKRFSPGLVTGHESDGIVLLADYTSLGGNSGSPVIRLDDGKTVGLHFAGTFKEANYSIAADIVAAARARVRTVVSVPAGIGVEAPPPRRHRSPVATDIARTSSAPAIDWYRCPASESGLRTQHPCRTTTRASSSTATSP